jgi:hypothetical protein
MTFVPFAFFGNKFDQGDIHQKGEDDKDNEIGISGEGDSVAEEGDQIEARQSSGEESKEVLEERKTGHDDKEAERIDGNGCKGHNQHRPERRLVKKPHDLENKFVFEDFVEEFSIDDVFKTSVVDGFAGQYPGYSNESDDEGFMESGKENDGWIVGNDIDEKISWDGIEE